MHRTLIIGAFLSAIFAAPGSARLVHAQFAGAERSASSEILTLREARERARRHNPDLRAEREAVSAAAALARQAGAYPNPTLSYSREQVGRDGATNTQDVTLLEQPITIGGSRGLRREAARLRQQAAEARLRAAGAQLDFEVTRAYALAIATDQRAALVAEAHMAFTAAHRSSAQRLAVGDVAGYAHRRLGLEAARYDALRAEAQLERRTARLRLATLIAALPDSIGPLSQDLSFAEWTTAGTDAAAGVLAAVDGAASGSLDSLLRVALGQRGELRAAQLEADAFAVDARVAGRDRVPVPAILAGFKREDEAGIPGSASGMVGGFSLPLPLWDRRRGAVDAAEADARQRAAAAGSARRLAVREVTEAFDAVRATLEQTSLLEPQLDTDSRLALQAAQAAYADGEISLVEWLDAVRAYQETQASRLALRAELMIRLAALELATGGSPGSGDSTADRGTGR